MRASYVLFCFIIACAIFAAGQCAFALTIDQPLANSADEARAKALFYEIRCVVCQSESIAESPADVATDIRRLIRQRIEAGETDASIKAYLVSRYGDAILMRPPLKQTTWLLWFGPLFLLACGGVLAACYFRRTQKQGA